MIFDRVFILFFLSLAGLAMTHYLALVWYLYWMYPWFDLVMHFSGGMIIALGSQTALFQKMTQHYFTGLLPCLLIVVVVSVVWELFEWYSVIVDFEGYRVDTSIDLVMDITGGVCGFFLASFLSRRLT